MSRSSVIVPHQPGRIGEVVPFAGLVKRGLAARLWLGQSLRLETHAVIAYLAGAGHRVPVGTSVALMALRNPAEAAAQARSLAALTGHPLVAGFGASYPELVERLTGAAPARPATAAGEYLAAVRTLLDGGDVRGFALPPLRHPPVEVGAGVLRPGMARVAGAYADTAVTWLTPPSYVAGVLAPALRERGGNPRIVTVVHAAVTRPGRDPEHLAHLAAGAHLQAAHYTGMLRTAGVDADPSDPRAGARALVRSGLFATGTPEQIAGRLAEYHAAGVDEVVVNTAGVWLAEGPHAAVRDAEEILTCLGRGDAD